MVLEKLRESLENNLLTNDQIIVDKEYKKSGVEWLQEVQYGLDEADMYIPLITRNYVRAKSCDSSTYSKILEIYSARNQERIIALFFEDPSVVSLPTMLGNLQSFVMSDQKYDEGLELLLDVIRTVVDEQLESYKKMQGANLKNPFRRIRAEEISANVFLRLFQKPESEKYDQLRGGSPVIVEGGRGSGKTMSLLSLEIEKQVTHNGNDLFRNKMINWFGIYWKANTGAIMYSSKEATDLLSEDMLVRLFVDDFNFKMLTLLIDWLKFCRDNGILTLNPIAEENIANTIFSETFLCDDLDKHDLQSATTAIFKAQKKLKDYADKQCINKREEYEEGIFKTNQDTLERIYVKARQQIPELSGVYLFLLIDEYENLLPVHQRVINSLCKNRGNVVPKITSKIQNFETETLIAGQPLQAPHDYSAIELDYNLSRLDDWRRYRTLALGIAERALKEDHYVETDISKILGYFVEVVRPEDSRERAI